MARKEKDIFGVEELLKEFEKMEKKYPNKADALLMTEGRTLQKCLKKLTGTEIKKKTGKLLKSWRVRPVKLYKDGTVRVVRVENKAPHSHLIEYGHEIYHGSGRGNRGSSEMTRKQRKAMAKGNKTRAYNFLERSSKTIEGHFRKEAMEMFNDLIKDVEV